jgi:hypothetical protein
MPGALGSWYSTRLCSASGILSMSIVVVWPYYVYAADMLSKITSAVCTNIPWFISKLE